MIRHLLGGIPLEFFWLFGALIVLLAIASSVAALLARRPGDEKKVASRANLCGGTTPSICNSFLRWRS